MMLPPVRHPHPSASTRPLSLPGQTSGHRTARRPFQVAVAEGCLHLFSSQFVYQSDKYLSEAERRPPLRIMSRKKKPPINGFRPHLNSGVAHGSLRPTMCDRRRRVHRRHRVRRPNPLVVVLSRTAARWCGFDVAMFTQTRRWWPSRGCCLLVRVSGTCVDLARRRRRWNE